MVKHQEATTGEIVDDGKPESKDNAQKADEMHVKVHAPYKVYFEGIAKSVSATNATGPFDILPGHHNFMTLLDEGEIVIRTERGDQSIPISHGVMHVKADQVTVFLDV